jgi:hypothetical protein
VSHLCPWALEWSEPSNVHGHWNPGHWQWWSDCLKKEEMKWWTKQMYRIIEAKNDGGGWPQKSKETVKMIEHWNLWDNAATVHLL